MATEHQPKIDVFITTIISSLPLRSRHERVAKYLMIARAPYKTYDVASDEKAKRYWKRKTKGDTTLPCVLVNGKVVLMDDLDEAAETGCLKYILSLEKDPSAPPDAPAASAQSTDLADLGIQLSKEEIAEINNASAETVTALLRDNDDVNSQHLQEVTHTELPQTNTVKDIYAMQPSRKILKSYAKRHSSNLTTRAERVFQEFAPISEHDRDLDGIELTEEQAEALLNGEDPSVWASTSLGLENMGVTNKTAPSKANALKDSPSKKSPSKLHRSPEKNKEMGEKLKNKYRRSQAVTAEASAIIAQQLEGTKAIVSTAPTEQNTSSTDATREGSSTGEAAPVEKGAITISATNEASIKDQTSNMEKVEAEDTTFAPQEIQKESSPGEEQVASKESVPIADSDIVSANGALATGTPDHVSKSPQKEEHSGSKQNSPEEVTHTQERMSAMDAETATPVVTSIHESLGDIDNMIAFLQNNESSSGTVPESKSLGQDNGAVTIDVPKDVLGDETDEATVTDLSVAVTGDSTTGEEVGSLPQQSKKVESSQESRKVEFQTLQGEEVVSPQQHNGVESSQKSKDIESPTPQSEEVAPPPQPVSVTSNIPITAPKRSSSTHNPILEEITSNKNKSTESLSSAATHSAGSKRDSLIVIPTDLSSSSNNTLKKLPPRKQSSIPPRLNDPQPDDNIDSAISKLSMSPVRRSPVMGTRSPERSSAMGSPASDRSASLRLISPDRSPSGQSLLPLDYRAPSRRSSYLYDDQLLPTALSRSWSSSSSLKISLSPPVLADANETDLPHLKDQIITEVTPLRHKISQHLENYNDDDTEDIIEDYIAYLGGEE